MKGADARAEEPSHHRLDIIFDVCLVHIRRSPGHWPMGGKRTKTSRIFRPPATFCPQRVRMI